jgi:hypothetical protein
VALACVLAVAVVLVPSVAGGMSESSQGAWFVGNMVVLLIGVFVGALRANETAADVLER